MSELSGASATLPPSRAPRSAAGQRVRPTNPFVEFRKEEIEQSIPARFEQQVRRYPGRVAVKTADYELSYDALNRTANQVARAILARRGPGQEPIALLFEHGAPMIVALLATLKAGKIYVPLDPGYPDARASHILRDSGVGHLVTDRKNLSCANRLTGDAGQVLNADDVDASVSGGDLALPLSPDDLACIVYTSGSTGEPKGVVYNHRFILHHVANYGNSIHICADDRLTLLFSYTYIGAVRDIFAALLNGAAVYPFDVKGVGLHPLGGWLAREEITVYNSVTTLFRHFVGTLRGELFPALRLLRIGGEPIRKGDVELYKRYFSSDCIVYTGMTITETGGFTEYFIDKETRLTGDVAPAGYALPDKEVLVLDDTGAVLGANRVGEIAVKSRYLAAGYWRRPELTRAAFLPAPEGGGVRIYRTGDLGVLRELGCLEWIGRKDLQVKVRGYRIELSEVEIALLELPEVEEAVVVARQETPGETCLVAYVVPAGETRPTTSALRRGLQEKLPEHMLPSKIVLLEALPLTSSGKVDRGALPAPGGARPELGTPFVAPRTPVEEVVAGIWAGVLGLDEIGVHDQFLALGGNSLLATQVVARLGDAFRMELPLPILFAAPTVADQAEALVRAEPAPGQVATIARLRRQIAGLSAEERRARLRDKKVTG